MIRYDDISLWDEYEFVLHHSSSTCNITEDKYREKKRENSHLTSHYHQCSRPSNVDLTVHLMLSCQGNMVQRLQNQEHEMLHTDADNIWTGKTRWSGEYWSAVRSRAACFRIFKMIMGKVFCWVHSTSKQETRLIQSTVTASETELLWARLCMSNIHKAFHLSFDFNTSYIINHMSCLCGPQEE